MRPWTIVTYAVVLPPLLMACAPEASGPASGAVSDTGPADLGPAQPDAEAGDDAAEDRDGGVGDAGLADLDPLEPAPVPEPPAADEVVETVTVTVRTGTGFDAHSDDPLDLCLGEGHCFGLNILDVDDREKGNTDVYHLDVEIPLSELNSLTLRAPAEESLDRWKPDCVDIRLDGVPVYCNDDIRAYIGTGETEGEVQSWVDPDGLQNKCVSCWGGTIAQGPMVGPPTPDSVQVWVRTDATRLTGLRLGHSAGLESASVVAWAYPLPEDDYTAVLTATGLEPNTEYHYRVEVDGDTSEPVRVLRTAPAPDEFVPVRMGFGSCSRLTFQPIFTPALAARPDLFLFIGDNNYANTRHRDALRWHYRRFRGLRYREDLVANVPTLAVWDDHDFLANNSNGTCLGKDVALDVFKEYWANPSYGLDETPGVFFRYKWGVIDFFMLDCRMYRPDVGDSGRRCEVDPEAPPIAVETGPLGPEQEAWLFEALATSEAPFKLLSCGSRFNPAGSTDSWASFPEGYGRLLETIDANSVTGVVLLSGDIHRSTFALLPGHAYDLPEITSSPLSYLTPSACNPEAPNQTLCYDSTDSFITLDIDPTLADPTLTAAIQNSVGDTVAEWVIRRSELE